MKLEEVVLNNQVNALARAARLIGKNRPVTLEQVFQSLADAEAKARFRCGFIQLHASSATKQMLSEHMAREGYMTYDESGNITLTDAGKVKSLLMLANQIEQYLS